MFNKLLHTRKLEQRQPIDHFLKYVIACTDCSIVCFFQCEGGGGYYEVWDIESELSIMKSSISQIDQMQMPFEYSQTEIAFFNEESLCLNILKYRTAVCVQSELQLPTLRLKSYLVVEMDEDLRPTYFKQCLSQRYNMQSQILILIEQFNIFSNPDGVCNDNYISSWQQGAQIGEITIPLNESIECRSLNEQWVVLFKQYFFEEKLVFYLWNPTQTFYTQMAVGQHLNICVLNVFLIEQQTTIKQEEVLEQTYTKLCFCANSNANQHPTLIQVTYDSNLQLQNAHNSSLELDYEGSLLLQVVWYMNGELILRFYSKKCVSCIGVYNLYANRLYILHVIKHNDRISDLYFSQIPKQFIEIYDNKQLVLEQQVQDIKLPDQTVESTVFMQHTLIPYPIVMFHYFYNLKMNERYNQDTLYELLRTMFHSSKPIQKNELKQEKQ